MGALHEGHHSLIRLAKRNADRVVVSLFVNPAQFARGEDFAGYPRDEVSDAASLAATECDLLFAPNAEAIYPPGFSTKVIVAGLGDSLEGATRPGHFSGVATVVAKLLILCDPDVAVLGEKDYQQLAVIQRLVLDLELPVRIVPAPIVREPDGLALSSRNVYLTAAERRIAPALHRELERAVDKLRAGVALALAEADGARDVLAAGFDAVDYFEAREQGTLKRPALDAAPTSLRLMAAARLGRTRLLDNLAI